MDAPKFAAFYSPEIVDRWPLDRGLEDLLAPLEEHGRYFGRVLHDYLTGENKLETDFGKGLEDYNKNAPGMLREVETRLAQGAWDPAEENEARMRLNFHRLNLPMLPFWIIEGFRDRPDTQTVWGEFTAISQDALAISAVHRYASREHQASIKSRFLYFDEANTEAKKSTEGILNEFDTAIVLLELARIHQLTVIPAPPQFESGKRSSANVDFVVIGPGKKTVGIQVKTSVSEDDVQNYDPHVILVDAKVDLENQLARRTEMRNSTQRVVGWAGIISAQRVHEVPQRRNDTYNISDPRILSKLLGTKMRVRPFVKSIPPALPAAATRVGERVVPRLQEAA